MDPRLCYILDVHNRSVRHLSEAPTRGVLAKEPTASMDSTTEQPKSFHKINQWIDKACHNCVPETTWQAGGILHLTAEENLPQLHVRNGWALPLEDGSKSQAQGGNVIESNFQKSHSFRFRLTLWYFKARSPAKYMANMKVITDTYRYWDYYTVNVLGKSQEAGGKHATNHPAVSS